MSSVKRSHKILAMVMALIMACSTLVLSGCAGATGSKDIELTPVVSSPAVGTDGVLRVGVDSTNAPYAGYSGNNLVGIDVDVAAAAAEDLGLKLELVDTAGQSADTMLNDGTVDVVMDVEQTGGSIIQGTQVGPYIEGGPALFTLVKSDTLPTVDLQSLAGTRIAAQKDSLSAWSVEELIGSGIVDPKETLADAFTSVENGDDAYAAADAVVGSYLAVDYLDLVCVKMIGTPIGVYMGVATENTQLASALTETLRTLRDNGELQMVLSKWLGPLSASVVMGTSAVTSQETAGTGSGSATVPEGEVDTGDDLPDPSNAGGV